MKFQIRVLLIFFFSLLSCTRSTSFLNVSYDATREFYQDYNQVFSIYWKEKTGELISFQQSHAGSAKQTRAVLDGLEADVVTLALGYDVDVLAEKNMIHKNWQSRLKYNSSPYTSTIIFLVRQGNPKKIKDWNDLIRTDVEVITPNPKTSGGARWNYLAAFAYALNKNQGNELKAKEFLKKLYGNVRVLDSGARGSATTFIERGIGDVFIAWENEAFLAIQEFGSRKIEIVTPSLSILAEPVVASVDKVVNKKGTQKIATAYLEYLYSPLAQELAAKHYYRPRDSKIFEKYSHQFPKLKLVSIEEVFGGWKQAQKKHFSDDGVFDQIIVK